MKKGKGFMATISGAVKDRDRQVPGVKLPNKMN